MYIIEFLDYVSEFGVLSIIILISEFLFHRFIVLSCNIARNDCEYFSNKHCFSGILKSISECFLLFRTTMKISIQSVILPLLFSIIQNLELILLLIQMLILT